MRYQSLVFRFVAFVSVVVGAANAYPVSMPVRFTLPGTDKLTMEESGTAYGFSVSGSGSGTASGYLDATLDVSFDPITHVATLNRLAFHPTTPGTVSVTTVTVPVKVLGITQDTVSITGGLETISGSGSLSGTTITGGNYSVLVNGGTISDTGGQMTAVDLSVPGNEIAATANNGTISVSAPTSVGGSRYSYSTSFNLPFRVNSVDGDITTTYSGTISGAGTFTHAIPEPGTVALLIGLTLNASAYGLWKWQGARRA